MNKHAIALTTAALVAAPASLLLLAAPANADVDRSGRCGGGTYELSVDREGAGYDVSVDLDRLAPGTRWRVVIRHEGKPVVNTVRTVERDGDLDVERYLRGTPGNETVAFTATRVGTKTSCSRSVTVA